MIIPNNADISDEQIETHFEGVRLAAGRIVGRGEQHHPLFLPLDALGNAPMIIDAALGYNALPACAQPWLTRSDIAAYLLVTEQWLAIQPAGTPPIRASQAPGRIEVIMAQLWTRQGEGFCHFGESSANRPRRISSIFMPRARGRVGRRRACPCSTSTCNRSRSET